MSTQVVQEFLNVATTKFSVPLKLSDTQQYLQDVLGPLCLVYPSLDLYRQALVLQQDTQYSFYDSLIIAGALQAVCDTLYSEDLQHGQRIRGLRILNLFIHLRLDCKKSRQRRSLSREKCEVKKGVRRAP